MSSSSKKAHVVQINVNPNGGVPKHRVTSAEVTIHGVAGDKQRNRRFHGGPKRAISLYSYEHIQALRAEGHTIAPGTTGENLTISGLDWHTLQIGDRLRIGEGLHIEITGYAAPCDNIVESFDSGEFKRISQKVNPGWSRFYAQVLVEGIVREGDLVERDAGESSRLRTRG